MVGKLKFRHNTDFASAAGIDLATVSRLRSGAKRPSFLTAMKVLTTLDLDDKEFKEAINCFEKGGKDQALMFDKYIGRWNSFDA